jgi:hypothetical protein
MREGGRRCRLTPRVVADRTGRARTCVGITSRIRPRAAPPVSSKARMKAVGNEPACTLRRAGDGREAPAHVTTHPAHQDQQPAGEPGEPISPAQLNKAKPVDFVPIGWSYRVSGSDQAVGSIVAGTPAPVWRRLPWSRTMGVFEGVVVIALVVGIASLIHLARTRARVMRYHDIPTPRVNEVTHGAEGTTAG